MFDWLFKKRKEETLCDHELKYTKLFSHKRSEFKNGSDVVTAYRLWECPLCGMEDKEIIVEKEFPVWWGSREKEKLIKTLISKSFEDEDSFVLSKGE